jgi:uncharacterized membrane protein YeiB
MASIVGTLTVVALLALVLDSIVGILIVVALLALVLDYSLRWCRSGSNGPMFSLRRRTKIDSRIK